MNLRQASDETPRESRSAWLKRWLVEKRITTGPTVIHVTHWKAGSQWIRRVLTWAADNRVVEPEVDSRQFLDQPICAGKVYPCVYVTKQLYDGVKLPRGTKRFVVIRDLRDTLVSGYFSFKLSHPNISEASGYFQSVLNREPFEAGMTLLMHEWLNHCAEIQRSWHEAGEPLTRYEDLLYDDVAIFHRDLIERCGLPCSETRFRDAVMSHRFEAISGRPRGQEDPANHFRKGVAGDWRNHFTDRLKDEFKKLYGDVLIATGYEADRDW